MSLKEKNSLKSHDSYHSYQENLAFEKELNILRNDFYYQLIDMKHTSFVDFLYQPLDVMSGDAYTARRLDEHRTFYLIVDGMGKGLSASLTAMIMTSFINHIIDKMLEFDSFSLHILIKESIDYMKPILLDDESVAVDFILFNTAFDSLEYAKFAMPAMLLEDNEQEIIRLKSNNPPISKWHDDFVVDHYDVSKVEKFLFYSDGMVENSIVGEEKLYAHYIEEDFLHSFTREDLKSRFIKRIDEQEDDITFIFINRIDFSNALTYKKDFLSTLEEADRANEWYSETINSFSDNTKVLHQAQLTFTELYLNAYEHGNLGLNSEQKHFYIENDIYFDVLQEKEKGCTKKVFVEVSKIQYNSSSYIVTLIQDEGEGFDTQLLSTIFRNAEKFNGRGVFISRKNSSGIYYNSKGNIVLFLNKI